MFTDFYSDVIGFSSKTLEKRNVSESATETLENISTDAITQSVTVENVCTQTDILAETPTHDEKSLETFLKKVGPLVEEELEIEVDFTEANEVNEDEDSVLSKLREYKNPLSASEFKVSQLAWNSYGGTLAVGFGVVSHHSWCNHESKLMFYHTFSQSSKCVRMMDTPSCVTATRFHPTQPSLLLAGLHNGNILVLDLSKEEEWATLRLNGPSDHSASIVAIGWLDDTTSFSADARGLLLQWRANLASRSVAVLHRYQLTRPDDQNHKVSGRIKGLEITAAAKVEEKGLIFGAADGALLHCSLAHQVSDPILQAYQPHSTVVTSIRPAAKLFASTSRDGQIRIFKSLQAEPIFILNIDECPLDIFWTNCPGILCVCSSTNEMKFIKVVTGIVLDLKISMSEKHAITVTEAMSERNVVAIGNSIGNVEIWRIVLLKQ